MSGPRPTPPGLDDRGQAMWEAITAAAKLDTAGELLLEEACRCADRLERLHWLVTGDASMWATVLEGHRPGEYTLHITGALVEARQQQQTLRALLGQLKLGRVATETDAEKGGFDDLSERRARRNAATAAPGGPALGE